MVLNFSPTGIHPVAGTDPDPASIQSRSDLYLIVQYYALSGITGREVSFRDCPGFSGMVGKYVLHVPITTLIGAIPTYRVYQLYVVTSCETEGV